MGIPDEVAQLYESGLSMQEIAERLNVTRPAIYQLMKRCNIPIRTKSQARRLAMAQGKIRLLRAKDGHLVPTGPEHDGTSLSSTYHHARKHRGPTCEQCGTSEDLHIHHIDEDPTNNELVNLRTLCRKHHTEAHRNPRLP